jgi:hypothetical protein
MPDPSCAAFPPSNAERAMRCDPAGKGGRRLSGGWALLLGALLALSGRCLGAVAYPADAVIDLTAAPYHADPTGVADSRAALQQALDDWDGGITRRHILYLPDGAYRLSGSLQLDTHDAADGGSGRGVVLQGQSRDGVVLRLDDAASGFGNPAAPRALVDFNEANDVGGWQYVAFQTHIKDLTIDTGAGNPGAIGLDFCANNVGGVRNVRIRSGDPAGAGETGLLLSGIPGPQLLKHVEIHGFRIGIAVDGYPHYATTLEDITLVNCAEAGIFNGRTSLAIHRLRGDGLGGPALWNAHPDAFTVLVDGDFANGPGTGPAVRNSGYLTLRHVRSAGYATALEHNGAAHPEAHLSEWHAGGAASLFDGAVRHTLGLPIEDAPDPDRDPPGDWVSALLYGGNVADDNFNDDAFRVQQAIDSMAPGQPNAGKRTLYLPPGFYIFDSAVVIPPHVERIVGCFARVKPRKAAITTAPAWRIAPGDGPPLIIEQLFSEPGGDLRATPFIENAGDRDLVLRDVLVLAGQAYRNSGAGRLFIENVGGTSSRYWTGIPQPLPSAIPQFDFGGQRVWARQLNTEQKDLKVLNDGGDLWILGIKNEEDGTLVRTLNGGRTEILGGTAMPLDVDDLDSAGFESVDASMSIAVAGHIGWARSFYTVLVRETRAGETRELLSAAIPDTRGYASQAGVKPPVLPLYRGSPLSHAAHWRLNHFGTRANAGPAADTADPDLDGIINLLERALGGDPNRPDTERLPGLQLVDNAGHRFPEFTFTVLAGGGGDPASTYAAGDLAYAVEIGHSLDGSWLSGPGFLETIAGPDDQGDGTATVRLRGTSPLSPAQPQLLRLRVR